MMTEYYYTRNTDNNNIEYADIDFQPLIDIERNSVEQQDNNNNSTTTNEITKAIKNEANKRRCWKTTTAVFLLIGLTTTLLLGLSHHDDSTIMRLRFIDDNNNVTGDNINNTGDNSSSDSTDDDDEVKVKCDDPDNLSSLLGIKSMIATECFEEQYPDFEVVTNMPGIRPFDDDKMDRIQLYINPDTTIHTITAPGIHEGIIHK